MDSLTHSLHFCRESMSRVTGELTIQGTQHFNQDLFPSSPPSARTSGSSLILATVPRDCIMLQDLFNVSSAGMTLLPGQSNHTSAPNPAVVSDARHPPWRA